MAANKSEQSFDPAPIAAPFVPGVCRLAERSRYRPFNARRLAAMILDKPQGFLHRLLQSIAHPDQPFIALILAGYPSKERFAHSGGLLEP